MTPDTMGLYQLVFPVFNVCFTLFASGIQLSVSKITAEYIDNSKKKIQLFILAIACSLGVAILLTFLIGSKSTFVASFFVKEPSVAEGLRILSYSFPFCAITSVINGYFYGTKKSGIPAISQILEQILRVGTVLFMAGMFSDSGKVSCELAVAGLVAGEIGSCIFNLCSLYNKSKKPLCFYPPTKDIRTQFTKMCIPLTLNRFILSLLHSFETIIFPVLLKRAGFSNDEALTTLGIINGMVIPFLIFPSAITSSISILLLPTISEAKHKGKISVCRNATTLVLKYSLILGYICFGIFMICGQSLCNLIFKNVAAGYYLTILAFLCPMMYFSATVPSILNGLGKPLTTFRNSCILNIIQILLLTVFITKLGIKGYFITMFLTQFVQLFLDTYSLHHERMLHIDIRDSIIVPGLLVGLLIPLFSLLLRKLSVGLGHGIGIIMTAAIFIILYLIMLIITKVVKKMDFM